MFCDVLLRYSSLDTYILMCVLIELKLYLQLQVVGMKIQKARKILHHDCLRRTTGRFKVASIFIFARMVCFYTNLCLFVCLFVG